MEPVSMALRSNSNPFDQGFSNTMPIGMQYRPVGPFGFAS